MNFYELEGLTIYEIIGCRSGSDEIFFKTTDDRMFHMFHWQDCCESVSVEDVVGDVEDLIGSPIVRAEERSNGSTDTEWGGDEEWTFYELATNKGSVTIRWYGSSNGYYSTSVSFEEVVSNKDRIV